MTLKVIVKKRPVSSSNPILVATLKQAFANGSLTTMAVCELLEKSPVGVFLDTYDAAILLNEIKINGFKLVKDRKEDLWHLPKDKNDERWLNLHDNWE
ncbi:hypothetical protein KAZ57_02525 [Patescibacteria group bacterium]|nr:hypothetical protein [Patescibacteria group bacterium]